MISAARLLAAPCSPAQRLHMPIRNNTFIILHAGAAPAHANHKHYIHYITCQLSTCTCQSQTLHSLHYMRLGCTGLLGMISVAHLLAAPCSPTQHLHIQIMNITFITIKGKKMHQERYIRARTRTCTCTRTLSRTGTHRHAHAQTPPPTHKHMHTPGHPPTRTVKSDFNYLSCTQNSDSARQVRAKRSFRVFT
jgi:hypothetical protein